jgi:hypothetical protein
MRVLLFLGVLGCGVRVRCRPRRLALATARPAAARGAAAVPARARSRRRRSAPAGTASTDPTAPPIAPARPDGRSRRRRRASSRPPASDETAAPAASSSRVRREPPAAGLGTRSWVQTSPRRRRAAGPPLGIRLALPQRSSGRRRSSRAAGRWPPGQPPTGPDDWGVGDQHPLDGVADLVLLFGGVDQRHEDPEDPGGDQGPLGLPGDLFQVDVSDAAQRGALVVHHGLVPPAARRLYRRSWHGPHRSLSG